VNNIKKYAAVLAVLLMSLPLLAGAPAAVSGTAEGGVFPEIVMQSLEDKYLSFPYEVTSQAKVAHIIVTFKRPDDKEMETWVRPFREKYDGNTRAAHYSMALVGDVGIINGLIFNGMRDSAGPDMKSHLLVYFRDKEPYKKFFNITDDSLIYNYIVDQKGTIRLARSGRAATVEDIKAILDTTESLLNPPKKSPPKAKKTPKKKAK
jgi:hypothetical protein